MGYRNYISLLEVEKLNEIKDKTYKQLQKIHGNDYVPCYELSEEVYEIGKYWDGEFIKKYKKDIFTRPATNKRYNEDSDGEFFAIGKEGLAAIIEQYRQKVVDYYKSVLNPTDRDKILGQEVSPLQHIERQLRVWDDKYMRPYNMDLESKEIVSSWQYEYAIFQLVHIYKTVDETKHVICITGW